MSTPRLFLLHLMSFVMPLATLAYLVTSPHAWWEAPLWLAFAVASIRADVVSPTDDRDPGDQVPRWPFDVQLLGLSALQLVNVALLVHRLATQPFWRVDTAVAVVLVGVTSGYSAIVVAHELVHRASRWERDLGRLLLVTVLYEHFATEHVRGHHKRVGTAEDPATARFGETYLQFWRRTLPAQFASAWALESKRIGVTSALDPRWVRHRVLQGALVELALLGAITVGGGPAALAGFLVQQFVAIHLLEAVNYMEHWGIARQERRVRTVDSFDTGSRFSRFTLVGLSRHADHHANAARPYTALRLMDESPKLPYGYFGSVMMVLFRNARMRELLTEELRRKKLGPFVEAA